MKEYPKIHSLWKRNGWYFDKEFKNSREHQDIRQSFIVGDYAKEEFGMISKWYVEEKIDGTNIRIGWSIDKENPELRNVRFGGRTSAAQIPCYLLDYLQQKFTPDLFENILMGNPSDITLYGEGYGPKINQGSYYSKEYGFCLFDVRIGSWWLNKSDVIDIAKRAWLSTPPFIGIMSENEVIKYVESKPMSKFAQECHIMEGVICRTTPMLLLRDNSPLMWKLKCKEF